MNTLPDKPKFGAQCNRCGVCCAGEICKAGEIVWPTEHPPCPGLIQSPENKNETSCLLVQIEIDNGMTPMLQNALGIGLGCFMIS